MVKKDKKETAQKPQAVKAPVAPKTTPVVNVAPPVVVPVVPPPPPISAAKQIWEDIKEVQLNMFALPDQTVEKYCKFIQIEPNRCFITIKVSSVLSALEEALSGDFNIESAGKFVILTRK